MLVAPESFSFYNKVVIFLALASKISLSRDYVEKLL